MDPRCGLASTPLHRAAYVGNCELIQVLLDYGLDVNARNADGETPLVHATYGQPKPVRLLLDHGADPNAQAYSGGQFSLTTPLHRAIEFGKIETARLLLERGASVEVKDWAGRTPLDVASGEQREEIIKFLSEHRAKR